MSKLSDLIKSNYSAGDKFDFDALDALMAPNGKHVSAGLEIVIAKGMLENAIRTCERFDNPLAPDLISIGNDLRVFNMKWKQASKERAEKLATIPAPAVNQRPILEKETAAQ